MLTPNSPMSSCTQPLLPLVLDLDGTLIRTDTFHEMMVYLLNQKPWVLFLLPFWFLKGRAYAKERLAAQCFLALDHLPYNLQLLTFARREAQKGRPLILATGADQHVAQKIADHLGIFQEAIGSDGHTNMTGPHKQKALLERFGPQGFDYAGDSSIDTYVWAVARQALVVHPKWGVLKRARTLKESEYIHHFPREKPRLWALFLALRPLMWVFNFIVPSWTLLISLSLLTSGLFLGGDLFMLHKERTGSVRGKSVFAEGHLHLLTAFTLAPLLILTSLFLIIFTFSWGALFSLVYIPLFLGLDRLTRAHSQGIRWLLLGFFQLFVAWMV